MNAIGRPSHFDAALCDQAAGCLPDDRPLSADPTAVDYGYDASDAIRLERRDRHEDWRFQEKLATLKRYAQ